MYVCTFMYTEVTELITLRVLTSHMEFLWSCLQMLGPEIDIATLEDRIFLLKTQDNAVS